MAAMTVRSPNPPRLRPSMLANGTIPAVDLQRSKEFYADVLGLEVYDLDAEHLVLHLGSEHTYVVERVDELPVDMPLLNHNGIWIADDADLEVVHDRLVEVKETYGIRIVQRPRRLHGPYAFWFQDCDGNWWELNHRLLPTEDLSGRPPMTAEEEKSWFQTPMLEGAELGERGWQQGDAQPSGLVQATRLSHGTLESNDLQASRRFYEEVLGLEVKQGSPASLHIQLGNDHNYAVVAGPRSPDMQPCFRNALLFAALDDVDAAAEEVKSIQELYAIREITEPRTELGRYAFRLRDVDGNWWELAYQANGGHRSNFASTDASTALRA